VLPNRHKRRAASLRAGHFEDGKIVASEDLVAASEERPAGEHLDLQRQKTR
jgi:hypothetical protein